LTRAPDGLRTLLTRMGWITVSHGATSVLRLLNNVVLAWLLAPALLGLMMIVNLLRTSIELLTDVGVGQNIVSNPNGDDPDFYDTAWTIQVFRGLILGVVCILSARVAASYFERPELAIILPFAALFSIIAGFSSVSTFLIQKKIAVIRFSKFEIVLGIINLAIYTAMALITRTIWALIIGTVISFAVLMLSTYLLIPGIRHRFYIDRSNARQILVFGKWIFWSSMVGFLAMNFDRFYFAKHITLANLGIFSIARSLSETIGGLSARFGGLILFPMVAEMQSSFAEIRLRLRSGRRSILLLAALGLGGVVASSDLLVRLLYDARYHDAGWILPILLIGVWFAILATISENILLGVSRPALAAYANGAKLLAIAIAAPLAFHFYGFTAALLALASGELVKYLSLWFLCRKHSLNFARDDLLATTLFLGSVIVIRELLFAIGLTGNLHALFPWFATLVRMI
jgi:O-antigen/teichoic acid export membrane protein